MKYDATMDYSDSLYGLAAHYQQLLEEVDGWFQRSLEQFPDRISCKKDAVSVVAGCLILRCWTRSCCSKVLKVCRSRNRSGSCNGQSV